MSAPQQFKEPQLTPFDHLLPPQALPLVLLLIVILPLVLLTGESLLVPLFEWLKTLAKLGNESNFDILPFHFFVKLIIFIVFGSLVLCLIVLRINTIYYSTWCTQFTRPHPLHADYQPDPQLSMMALVRWKGYQIFMVLMPPVGMITLTALIGLLAMTLFNAIGELSFIATSIQLTLSIFIVLMLAMLSVFSVLNSCWNMLSTMFGSAIAVTEPELPAKTVFERCNRIALASKSAYALYPASVIFALFVLAEVVVMMLYVDISQMITFQANLLLVLLGSVITVAGYLILNYLRFTTYHEALRQYYIKMPQQIKDCFTPPPPAVPTYAEYFPELY